MGAGPLSTENFFASPQGAAIVKHTVLGAYIRLFVNKLGSTHGTVYYLDGYAGPGVYGDGTHGSPKLAVEVAELVSEIRDLRCTFVEKDADHAAALAGLIDDLMPSAVVIHGELQDHVDEIATRCDDGPLLAFIDPFGLGISFDSLARLTKRANTKTDIIMNVSLSALRRVGGQLTSTSANPTYLKAKATMLGRMDEVLGGDWWREIWRKAKEAGSDEGAIEIAYEYAQRCKPLRGGYFMVAVKDRWNGPPAYMLLLLAGHPDANWNFNEMVSIAYDKLREVDAAGQLLRYQDDYPPILKENVRQLLATKTSFIVGDSASKTYGPLLGIARSTHLRSAIKQMCKDGEIRTTSVNDKGLPVENGQGDMQKMTVHRP